MEELKYWLALGQFYKFGPVKFRKLKAYFPNLASAYSATVKDLARAGIDEKTAEEFIIFRHGLEPERILENLNREKIKTLIFDDPAYPKLLKQIYDPPYIIYYRGDLGALNEFSLAVVGTRKFSHYGRQATEKLVKDLTACGLTIVSGLAMGIDALAHAAALASNGRTAAVLASGLDQRNLYPSQNRYLAEKILSQGGIILSEYPMGTMSLKQNFPQRNRIISGLSLATLVIEAGEKSGAVITALHALEQNREVFAVPGSIYSPVSAGTNNLIKQGAKPIIQAADVLEALNLSRAAAYIENKKIIPATVEEELILKHLTHEIIHVDELKRLTKLDTSVINSTLTFMEMKGIVKNLGGMQYVLAR